MNSFNFESQVCTDKIESERLLALGLKRETADMIYKHNVQYPYDYDLPRSIYDGEEFITGVECDDIPAWSLHRLLCMLPDDAPKIFWILDGASITIDVENDCNTFFPHRGDIYKGVVDCIEWLIKEGYFIKEYLV